MNLDNRYILLTIDSEELILRDNELSCFVYETTGTVAILCDDESKEVIGRFSLAYVDVSRAMHADEPIGDVFDSSKVTMAFYNSIYLHDTDELRADLEQLLGGDLPWTCQEFCVLRPLV